MWVQDIANLTSTLQDLVIQGDGRRNKTHEAKDIGSLAQFQLLKSIRMEWATLLGPDPDNFSFRNAQSIDSNYQQKRLVDVLPKSLELLELTTCELILPQIAELIERKEELVPELRSIWVDVGMKGLGEINPLLLVDEAKEKGVRLTIYGMERW